MDRRIAQKIAKMKRRGKKKVFGAQFVNTGQGPKIGSVHELYGSHTGNRLIRNKVTGAIGVAPDICHPYLQALFPGKTYTDDQLFKQNVLMRARANLDNIGKGGRPEDGPLERLHKNEELEDNGIPLAEVKLSIIELLKEQQPTMFFTLLNRPNHKIHLYFNSRKTQWTVVELKISYTEALMRRSVPYNSRSLAEQALRLRVTWVEVVPLPTSPL